MTVTPLPDDAGVRVLRAAGELDVATVPAVLPAVPALVAGAHRVVLDLSAVTFLDSSGVQLLDRMARQCARAGAAFPGRRTAAGAQPAGAGAGGAGGPARRR